MKIVLLSLLAAVIVPMSVVAGESPLYSVPLKDIQGKEASLKDYKGKVLLLVNVASKCGYTPQYAGLEALYRKHKDAGLVVIGFPCNQFGGQEPGTPEEIVQFCKSNYEVSFPIFQKVDVNGASQHPLYKALLGPDSPAAGQIKWNFEKILVGRDGQVIKRFPSKVKPDDQELVDAIGAALAKK